PQGRTLMVASAAGSGPGTLRQALQDAQNGDTITFDPVIFPPDAPVTISLSASLPELTQGSLTLDASDAGIILDGSKITKPEFVHGLVISSHFNTIRGLQITGFSDAGIALSGGAQNNIIGGDPSVGNRPLGQFNIIYGNGNFGIGLWDESTSYNTIQGNIIGIKMDGTAEGHARDGIHSNGATQNLITGNIIGGNVGAGVYLCCVADGRNVVSNNLIGVGFGGVPLGNGSGVIIDRSHSNIVGPGNLIAHNHGGGLSFWEDTPYNTVTQNSIHDNGGGGISITSPGQSTLQPPSILKFDLQAGTVSGTACANCTVEIFSDDGDEGAIFEGQAKADANGAFTFEKGIPLPGPFLTATATDPDGSTSEFSRPTLGSSSP
ncbi:MAG TPA: NosD domain-containing protein, partial [Anaerolineae bacterium]